MLSKEEYGSLLNKGDSIRGLPVRRFLHTLQKKEASYIKEEISPNQIRYNRLIKYTDRIRTSHMIDVHPMDRSVTYYDNIRHQYYVVYGDLKYYDKIVDILERKTVDTNNMNVSNDSTCEEV